MNIKLLTTILSAVAALGCSAQTLVTIPVGQNPPFEVSTNHVAVAGAEGSVILGGDLVVAGGSGQYTYRWYDADNRDLSVSPTLTVSKPGCYNLDITDACDCLQTVVFDVSTSTALDLTGADQILLTPNPTDGPVSVRGFEPVQIAAVNMAGQMVFLLDSDSGLLTDIDFSPLQPGQYVVTLTDRNRRTVVTRLVKK
ncbi:MAG: T9SS type A sorting domain-containing protein [Clostridium sp.]|nr:T9SS type A sorting domain-containing protein [Clostridium sp.]